MVAVAQGTARVRLAARAVRARGGMGSFEALRFIMKIMTLLS